MIHGNSFCICICIYICICICICICIGIGIGIRYRYRYLYRFLLSILRRLMPTLTLLPVLGFCQARCVLDQSFVCCCPCVLRTTRLTCVYFDESFEFSVCYEDENACFSSLKIFLIIKGSKKKTYLNKNGIQSCCLLIFI